MARIEPGRLKTLSDILALVLEDHEGESAAALAAVRRRARRDGMTGGALKELMAQVNQIGDLVSPDPLPRATASTRQLQASLNELQRRFVETRMQLDRERRESQSLRMQLNQRRLARRADAGPDAAWLQSRVRDLEERLRAGEPSAAMLAAIAERDAAIGVLRDRLALATLSRPRGRGLVAALGLAALFATAALAADAPVRPLPTARLSL